jgi:hypothetical protein
MGWRDWLGRGGTERPTIDDVTFDTSTFSNVRTERQLREWQNATGDRMLAHVERGTPDHPLLPWTLEAVRAAERERATTDGGGIIAVTAGYAGSIPIVAAICKRRRGLGYEYHGAIMIRFRDAVFHVALDAREGNRTGVRESIASAILVQIGEVAIPVAPPGHPRGVGIRMTDLTGDPYDPRYDEAAVHMKSDDERLDEIVPGHALSRVRAWLARVQQTLAVSADLESTLMAPSIDPASPGESRYRMSALAVAVVALHVGRADLADRHITAEILSLGGEPALDAPRAGETLTILGAAREARGRADDAAWAFDRAVTAFRAAHGEDHLQTFRAKAGLGRVYAASNRPADAEALLAIAIPAFQGSNEQSELAVALQALGRVRQLQSRHADALPILESALSLFERGDKPPVADRVRTLRDIATSAEAIGDEGRRRDALRRADTLQRTTVH